MDGSGSRRRLRGLRRTRLVLRAEEEEVRLGGAASVACLLRHLGARVTLAGVVGDDPGGRTVRRLMDEILSPADSGRPTDELH